MKEEEFNAWLGGFIDGEGCISVVSQTGRRPGVARYAASLIIANTHRPTLDYIYARLGVGAVQELKRAAAGAAWRRSYQYQASGVQAVAVVRRVMPYLFTKRAQAEVFVGYPVWQQHGRSAVPDEVTAERRRIFLALKELKVAS